MNVQLGKIVFALGFVSLGAVGSFGLQALAEPPTESAQKETHEAGARGAPFMRLMDRVELTDGQKEELEAMKQSHQEERKSQRSGASRNQVLQMFADQDIEREAVHALIDEQMEVQAELMHAHTDDYLDFVEALDVAQKEDLAGLAEKVMERMSARQAESPANEEAEPRRTRRSR